MISLIAAVGRNNVIGLEGKLPWDLPDDMQWFKTMTRNKPVIMGRKTFDALGRKPLPKRVNIVISRHPQPQGDGTLWTTSLDGALALARQSDTVPNEEIMIIGGGEIYTQGLAVADRIYLTEVDASPAGDAYFPVFDKSLWRKTILQDFPPKDGRPGFVIAQYDCA